MPAAWQGLATQCGQVMDALGMHSGWLEDVLLPWAESALCGAFDGHKHHALPTGHPCNAGETSTSHSA